MAPRCDISPPLLGHTHIALSERAEGLGKIFHHDGHFAAHQTNGTGAKGLSICLLCFDSQALGRWDEASNEGGSRIVSHSKGRFFTPSSQSRVFSPNQGPLDAVLMSKAAQSGVKVCSFAAVCSPIGSGR